MISLDRLVLDPTPMCSYCYSQHTLDLLILLLRFIEKTQRPYKKISECETTTQGLGSRFPPPPTTSSPLFFYFMGSGGGWVSSGRRARTPEQSGGRGSAEEHRGRYRPYYTDTDAPKKSHIRRRSWLERHHSITLHQKKKNTLHAGSSSGVQKILRFAYAKSPSESGDFSCI